MNTLRELSIAKVISDCGQVQGRVKLQKIVYLLTAMGYGLPYRDFRIQHYGPFSPKLAAATDFLSNAGVVTESSCDVGGGSPRYDYGIEDRWTEVLHDYVTIAAPEGAPDLGSIARNLNQKDRAALEIAATMCYLHCEEGLVHEDLNRELVSLKGHLHPFEQNVEKAKQILQEIGVNVG